MQFPTQIWHLFCPKTVKSCVFYICSCFFWGGRAYISSKYPTYPCRNISNFFSYFLVRFLMKKYQKILAVGPKMGWNLILSTVHTRPYSSFLLPWLVVAFFPSSVSRLKSVTRFCRCCWCSRFSGLHTSHVTIHIVNVTLYPAVDCNYTECLWRPVKRQINYFPDHSP